MKDLVYNKPLFSLTYWLNSNILTRVSITNLLNLEMILHHPNNCVIDKN